MAALNHFFPRSADKCQSFFQLLKSKVQRVEWTIECSEAFNNHKEQLPQLPTLQPPIPGEPLTIYMVSTKSTVSVVLVTEAGGEAKASLLLLMCITGGRDKLPAHRKVGIHHGRDNYTPTFRPIASRFPQGIFTPSTEKTEHLRAPHKVGRRT